MFISIGIHLIEIMSADAHSMTTRVFMGSLRCRLGTLHGPNVDAPSPSGTPYIR